MPEKGVVKLIEREIMWAERQVSKADRHREEALTGSFVTHPECCARPTGNRLTFSIGDSMQDNIDNALSARMVPTKFINELKISGRIHAKARGKELVFAICNSKDRKNYIFRTNFALEGICFWIPTEWYMDIVSRPVVPRGEKSFAFPVPDDYVDGPAENVLISIQAAFVLPKWTLIFTDHNVMISFHLMKAGETFTPADLAPGSEIWPNLWSSTHGPVYDQEPIATIEALDGWRSLILSQGNTTPIFALMKSTQTVFNGSGAQEATDQLTLALISPQMPAIFVCQNDALWQRFRGAFIDYGFSRNSLVFRESALPFLSGLRPFRMNTDGHNRYMKHVTVYRREFVNLPADKLAEAHRLNLFQPRAVIQPDGRAILPTGVLAAPLSAPSQVRTDRMQASVRIHNYSITMAIGRTGLVSYSPFTAQACPSWKSSVREMVGSDVKNHVNKTTLGLYSFRIFVDCVWSAQKLGAAPVPRGRRAVTTTGHSNRKRPLAEDIAKTAAPKKRRIAITDKENVNISEGRVTRSGKRLA